MTTPTDDPKVKELLEATRQLDVQMDGYYVAQMPILLRERIQAALAAFDPPKPKQYPPMPPWDEFIKGKRLMTASAPWPDCVDLGTFGLSEPLYNAIREATAKD